ncbi:hypothetical protein HD806DRAFT_507953 [Xylariaceae sp. AK1471]|nr:hypothetical protein HD806DRAFT_507953 [Xylariaceae sp. AK1471]
MMLTVDIETALGRGVYFWCLISLLSDLPRGIATAFLLFILSSGYFIYGSHLVPPNADVCRRQRVIAAGAAAYGLTLYAATRLLFRWWSPATLVGIVFGVSQAWSLSLAAMNSLNVSSRHVYNLFQKFNGIPKASGLVLARIKNRFIRVPLQVAGSGVWLSCLSITIVLNTLADIRNKELPGARLRTREWRRKFRTWASPFLFRIGSSYKHRQLLDSSPETPKIRLLKLRRRWPLGRISCELINVDLHGDLEYDAISYHWGKASFTEDIHIDGETFKVAPVVEELLYHLSSYRRDRLLWIDAICINQLDSAEKDFQIRLMRDVYRRAASVIIWLDGVKDTWMARCMLAGIWHEYVYGTTESCVEMLYKYSELYLESGWMQLMNLFVHPWFSRTWVIQEIVMAQTAVVLASGEPLPFDHIATFARMMTSAPYSMVLQRSNNLGVQEDATMGLGHVALMSNLLESRDAPRAGLGMLLGVFADFRATEDVDRIYGILGLLRAEEADQPYLQPDSSKNVEKVYTDVARHLIPTEPQDVLSYAGIGYRRKLDSLPSWSPDWTSVAIRDTYRMHFAKIQRSARFACGAGFPLLVAFSDDPGQRLVMRILGHVLDEVHRVGPEMGYTAHNAGLGGTDEEITGIFRSHMCSRQLVMDHARQPYPTGQPLEDVFWRSLIADTQFERPAPVELGVGCREWERSLSQVARLEPDYMGDWDKANDAPSLEEMADRATRLSLEWNSARIMAATGRAVAVTKEGYVGMVPPGTEVGDLMCVFYGMNTPFVIKPQVLDQDGGEGETRLVRLVGEAYVHGMMDGQTQMMADAQPELFSIV